MSSLSWPPCLLVLIVLLQQLDLVFGDEQVLSVLWIAQNAALKESQRTLGILVLDLRVDLPLQ